VRQTGLDEQPDNEFHSTIRVRSIGPSRLRLTSSRTQPYWFSLSGEVRIPYPAATTVQRAAKLAAAHGVVKQLLHFVGEQGGTAIGCGAGGKGVDRKIADRKIRTAGRQSTFLSSIFLSAVFSFAMSGVL
jgi:hypothetical protein